MGSGAPRRTRRIDRIAWTPCSKLGRGEYVRALSSNNDVAARRFLR